MNTSSMYLNHIDGFSDGNPKAISLKHSQYMLTNSGNNSDPIASLSSCQYMSDPILKEIISTEKVNISIRLSIGILMCFSTEGSATNLSFTTASVSSLGNLPNRLTIS